MQITSGAMWRPIVAFVVSAACVASAEWYDTYSGHKITAERAAALNASGLIPYCALEIENCSYNEPRRMDSTCNNPHYPSRGAVLTPYHRLLPPQFSADGGLRRAKSGRPLPNARAVRVAILPDGRVSSEEFTQLLVYLTVAIIGDSSSVHDTANYLAVVTTCCQPGGEKDPRCIPIRVSPDDLHLRTSNVRCLNLTRSITYQSLGCVDDTVPQERINLATPMLDLSIVYGSEGYRAAALREGKGGRLKSEVFNGKEWPRGKGTVCFNNEPGRGETRCHEIGDGSANGLLGITIATMWYFRNHNYLADNLSEMNPSWTDDQLFAAAKEINIAIWQNIVYYELMPTILGYNYLVENGAIYPGQLHVDDYDETMEPQVSLEMILASRWFHVLQEGRMNIYDPHFKLVKQLAIVDFTLRTGALAVNDTIAGITRGTYLQACASNHKVIDPDMGERSLGRMQRVSDVAAADIMKNRDIGLPPYNEYRKLCGLPVAKDFHDLRHWMPQEHVEALYSSYEHVDDIDLLVGIISENPLPGAVTGPTLACIVTDQLLRWRKADRFWYENTRHPGAFTHDQLAEIKSWSVARLLCTHGDGVEVIQPRPLLLPGVGNELTPCSSYQQTSFEPWRDHSCAVKGSGYH
ncbi:hypothetical protein ACJJTC_003521 [Scirpophaga incertulas]